MLVSQALAAAVAKNPNQIAFRYLGQGVTYRAFYDMCGRMSYYLQKEIGHGGRVALWMSNCPHVAYAIVSLSNTRNCAVPLNPLASPQDNLAKIKATGADVFLCTRDLEKTLKEFLQQNGLGHVRVIEIESKHFAEYDKSFTAQAGQAPNEKDEILLFYTQGTMGKQKGCLFNHAAVTQAMTSVKNAYRALPSDVFFCQEHYSTAFRWIHFLLAPLLAGSTVLISDEREPEALLKVMTESRASVFAPDPKLLAGILGFAAESNLSLPSLKAAVFPGFLPARETWALLKKLSKASVLNVYGLTEYLGTVAMCTSETPATHEIPGFCGPVLAGTKARAVDDHNDEIDRKKPQRGQLTVMGAQLMSRYLDLSEEQKHAIRGTWLYTGDYVEIDKDGRLLFLDRKADLVELPTGEKVQPRAIEALLLGLEPVAEAAYINVRDRHRKTVTALVVERKLQATLNEKQLQEFLPTKLVRAKLPAAVFFVDAMPRTPSGAIHRARLRQMFDGAA